MNKVNDMLLEAVELLNEDAESRYNRRLNIAHEKAIIEYENLKGEYAKYKNKYGHITAEMQKNLDESKKRVEETLNPRWGESNEKNIYRRVPVQGYTGKDATYRTYSKTVHGPTGGSTTVVSNGGTYKTPDGKEVPVAKYGKYSEPISGAEGNGREVNYRIYTKIDDKIDERTKRYKKDNISAQHESACVRMSELLQEAADILSQNNDEN